MKILIDIPIAFRHARVNDYAMRARRRWTNNQSGISGTSNCGNAHWTKNRVERIGTAHMTAENKGMKEQKRIKSDVKNKETGILKRRN